jgi:sulfopyruvate decarboxylase subunit alpha
MRTDILGRELFDQVCDASEFADALSSHFNWICCVPDSIYQLVLPRLVDWQIATRENHAISMAFGAKLGGKKPVVLMQNSGLGLCIDSLLGTFSLYKQGLVIVVSQRGRLGWEEIQHRDWGSIASALIDSCGFLELSFAESGGISSLSEASSRASAGEIVILSIQRGNLNE